ncbi:MAG: helix-turn-helix transcriptional regulator [Clostridia bacterium]|nr:helix-turn-helix transcriptional regulator [Clostridia bacterium]
MMTTGISLWQWLMMTLQEIRTRRQISGQIREPGAAEEIYDAGPGREPRRTEDEIWFNEQVGEKIRRKRNELGMSQEELGQRSNIRRVRIGLIERGQVSMTQYEYRKICLALACAPAKLWVPGESFGRISACPEEVGEALETLNRYVYGEQE